MGEVIDVQFTPEEQDLVGTIDEISEAARDRTLVALAFVALADDGSYEMSWAGDLEFPSAIEALKLLIRALRKEHASQLKVAAKEAIRAS